MARVKSIEIIYPDDWHIHLREDVFLHSTVPYAALNFRRCLVMPNLSSPLTTTEELIKYRKKILALVPEASSYLPYMTLYLNHQVTPDALLEAKNFDFILGAKLYPANATTLSEAGAHDILALYPLLEVMQDADLVLQVHGEDPSVDIFDREKLFITKFLIPIIKNFPRLRIVLEHISTQIAVEFVQNSSSYVAATITPHHLFYDRNDLLNQGIKPHLYCLPILKRKEDKIALKNAAISGNPKFFAGTDSAPHAINKKENACGCAGIFSSPFAVAIYAQIFAELNKLDYLEGFLSRFGARFYHLPYNTNTLALEKRAQIIPATMPFGNTQVVPIAAGKTIAWSVREK